MSASCNLRACLPDYVQDPREKVCENGSKWKLDCNTCVCVDERARCTRKACDVSRTTELPPDAVCKPGSFWKEECNTCRCSSTGRAVACTVKACIGTTENADEPKCTDGSKWKRDDCNWCDCVEGKIRCTQRVCGHPTPQIRQFEEKEEMCTEGSRWRVSCNWCSCMNGTGGCTKKGCPPDFEERTDAPECEGTSRWKKDCNWCNCHNGRGICTTRACISTPAVHSQPTVEVTVTQEEPECTEGSRWLQSCNSCRCIEGKAACSKRRCIPDFEPSPDEPVCHGNSSWRVDCNWCNCANGKAICTYKACGVQRPQAPPVAVTVTREEGATCTEGSHWRLDCNWCRCIKGQGACTKRGCSADEAPGPDDPVCEGTSSWKRDCNWCNCEDGKAVCTEMACDLEDSSCDRTKCPWKRWAHYLVKNCIPQYEDGACCPTSFSCPPSDSVIPDPTKCYYRGNFYENGEEVPVEDVCSASCRCHAETAPQIHCANIECPSLFRPPRPGCRLLFSPDQCCSTDEECRDPAAPPDLETRAVGCSWGNKTYQIGDKMYFDDFQCQSCVCTPEFTSPTGPGCSKIDCGFEFRYTSRLADGCVPIFFEDKCCSIDWLCPGDSRITPTDAVQQQQRVSPQKKDDQCHLGELTISHGSKLNINNCRIDCRCTTPPELTCVQYRSCELAAEVTQPKDCPEVNCPPACQTITDVATGCPVCSCTKYTFSCEKKECPSGCRTDFDSKTGCLTCKCQCPKHPVPCPMDCAVRHVMDETTGCEVCECDPNNPGNPFVPLGRSNCPTYPLGRLPCPQDCAVRTVVDERGCEKCECDPNHPGNPFGPPQRSDCPTDYTGRAPCPMDCAIRYVTDPETGCEKCECDPANPGHPFGPPLGSNCPRGPSGKPPCPMDCAIRYVTDPETGCEICECDPANPGHPFGPHIPPPRMNCPVGPSGEPPCPMDCAIQYVTDPETGCVRCECDPNRPGHPFGPQIICPRDHTGKPPCPMDCAIRIVKDEQTGCDRCECDPNNPGNPFGPY
nr:kielin/chordin-like protein isoform X3 [Penaeus vannamei]